jgi:hypothetical protein
MRSSRLVFAALLVGAGVAGVGLLPSASVRAQRAGSDSFELAGRTVRCESVRIVTDNRLPSEGAAAPGVLILNPRMMDQQPPIVRLFVFHHECGHHNVGDSELKADCWAVDHGVRDGWLDPKGLKQVCDSFEDAPETDSHPSGRRRCRNLDQCFATAVAALPANRITRTAASVPTASVPGTRTSSMAPKLVSGPKLVGTGRLAYSDPGPCAEPYTPGPDDAIGKLLKKDGGRPAGCK